MQRIAFLLQIKPGNEAAYDEAHRHVWPELVREMESFGITEYSIFRRGLQLFLTMRVANFDDVMRKLAASDINLRWQQSMAPLFDPVPGLQPSETFALMHEVFYMPGTLNPRTTGDSPP